ncbi:MAG: endonuclease domain-containing protein [Prosthecobacter sp.]|jgi:very-short-patch-repair endonuclease|uniref:endonuclease domain-containing protein n=1 Tax=Prosthecobacter sp. TaxID=1965333 RepID=UPI0019E478B1|nr:endonuclease domain-containing protein [Prosthecobacter sp.]MBE2283018.1 endonuclease domain-containing protein [Prosthecobacter sp.]
MPTRLEEIRHEITGERLELIEFARKLRRDATDAEALLWSCLRDRRVNRRKFRRQHPVEPYVLDFYCAELNLAIELDGGQHNSAEGRVRDEKRTAFLRSKGIETLRFTNQAMLGDTDSVLSVIWERTRRKAAPLTQPLPASSDAS